MEVLTIHISAFIITILLVIVSDLHALGWVTGFLKRLPQKRLITLHILVSAGLATSITTGLFLFWPEREYLLTDPAFQIKLLLVLMLIINAWVIHRHMQIAFTQTFRELSINTKLFLLLSGLVSTGGWIGIFFAARAIGL